jgi:hypothetical protein
MRRALLLIFALAGCGKRAVADLPAIAEARSLGAEWALVNEQAAEGKLSGPYVRAMQTELREQLQTTASSLTRADARYEIQALLAQPDDAAPEKLRAHVSKLREIEDRLESA